MDTSIYRDGFKDWTDVQSNFSMTAREPDEVVFAEYDLSQSYEGSAEVIYRNGNAYYWASGSHCSCFGLEGQWDPTEYTANTLSGALDRYYDEKLKAMWDAHLAAKA